MRQVLGRDIRLWKANDTKNLISLIQYCGKLLLEGPSADTVPK